MGEVVERLKLGTGVFPSPLSSSDVGCRSLESSPISAGMTWLPAGVRLEGTLRRGEVESKLGAMAEKIK